MKKEQTPPDIQPGTIAYKKQSNRQIKTNPPYKPEHIIKSTDLTVTTPQNTYHKQVFKIPRLTKNQFLQDDDTPADIDPENDS